MKNIIDKISDIKHLELIVSHETIALGSVIYTYALTQHKKVSFVSKEQIDRRYAFLPWVQKIKKSDTPAADLSIKVDNNVIELYELFKEKKIKLNKKMATAFYAAFLIQTKGLDHKCLNGTIFAILSELIAFGAEYKLAYDHLVRYHSLGYLRLKANMLEDMLLVDGAKEARFHVMLEDFKASGTDLDDLKEIVQEAFCLPYVEVATIFMDDKEIYKINKEGILV